jgi:Zn-dependent protease with chaperone function
MRLNFGVSQPEHRMKAGDSADATARAVDSVAPATGARGATDSTAPVPVGLTISVVVLALVVGGGAAGLIQGATPRLAWAAGIGLCGGLFVVTRWLARSAPTHARFLVVVALACVTLSYLLTLGGESTPRPIGGSATSFFTFVVMLLAVAGAAVAVPALILVTALRSGQTHEPHQLRLDITPHLLTASTGAAMLLLALLLLATALWASSPEWRVLAIVSVGLGSPVVLLPLAAYMYLRLLSRWRVPQHPRALLEGLETLWDRTGFAFDDVLCLRATFGNGRVCQVVTRPGHSTLVLSESIADNLNAPQLLAVLAHEAAHVCLNHLRRKIAWGAVAGVAVVTTAVAAQMLAGPFLPRSLKFAGMLGVLLPLLMLRGLYDALVTRRHEAEADEFAVDTAGGQALIDALDVLGASGPGAALVHNRWTTHSTWERRAAKIREWEKSRRAG